MEGQFYEANFDRLEKQIKECFQGNRGPGDLPLEKREKRILGLICPDASYQLCGGCMAWAYKEVAEANFPNTYVVIGTSHSNLSGITLEDFETPFGVVKNYGKKIIGLKENELAHKFEHSIEVQLPFLQFISKDHLKNLRVLPLVLKKLEYEQIKDLAELINLKNILIIGSAELTDYENTSSCFHFNENIKGQIMRIDKNLMNFIVNLDAEGLLNYIKKKNIPSPGSGVIALTIELCKRRGAKKGRLLQYYTSGNMIDNYESIASYCSIVFE